MYRRMESPAVVFYQTLTYLLLRFFFPTPFLIRTSLFGKKYVFEKAT